MLGRNPLKAKSPKKKRAARQTKAPASVHTLEIVLVDTDPKIWRKFAVPSDMRLSELYAVIEIVMGWDGGHLHQFLVAEKRYVPNLSEMLAPGPGDEDQEAQDEGSAGLCDIAPTKGSKFHYEYDFGDSWMHELTVLDVGEPEKGVKYPVCLDGKMACPPEDCGGVFGYYEALEAVADPKHEDHEMWMDAVGKFDATAFSLRAVNAALKKRPLGGEFFPW